MDKYEVIEEMGGGTLKRTALLWHKAEKKKYVLKKIQLVNPTEQRKQTARREMTLISRIRSPFVVEYKEAWMEKGCCVCIVTDYCEGSNMAKTIEDASGSLFPETKLCKWFAQLLIAMDRLHSNHILHRDLKCSNILLTEDEDIRLGDFGLAKLLNGDDATPLVGTPNCMCPELLTNIPYSFKSDIWSLGCCMFEMTSHQPAFRASDPDSLINKINRSSIGTLPSIYSSSTKSLIKSMLRKNPEDRPTASELLKRPLLQKYLSECVVPPMPAFCPSPVRKWGNARRESLTVTPCRSSLNKDKDGLIFSEVKPREELCSADTIKCTEDNSHRLPSSSSGDDTSTTTDATTSDTRKEEHCLQKRLGAITSRSATPKDILIGSESEVTCAFEFPKFPPSVASSGQTSMNCNAFVQTKTNCERHSTEESKLGCKDASSDPDAYNGDNEISGAKNYQERAEALEYLLELCAQLFEQQRLEELAGVLKPFGKQGASSRDTAIWVTTSMKAVGEVHHNRNASL